MPTNFLDYKNIWSFNLHRHLYRDILAGVFTNMVSLSACWKRAASQAFIPQRPLLVPPGSDSLAKSSRRLSITPKKYQADYARASSVAIEELFEEVNITNKEDTETDKDNNCGFTT